MTRQLGMRLASLLLVALAAMPAAASEWWYVNSGPNRVLFIDANSIERKKDVVTYWTMYVIHPGEPHVMTKAHMRADCARRTLGYLSEFQFDAQGRSIGDTPSRPGPMKPVPPDSLGDAQFHFACGDDGDRVVNDQFRMAVDEVTFAKALLAKGNIGTNDAHDLHDAMAVPARSAPAQIREETAVAEDAPLAVVQAETVELAKAVPSPVAESEEAVSLDKDCTANNGAACKKLAKLYAEGDGVNKDAARAAALYEKGCKAGNADACTWLGIAHVKGEGVAIDEQAATAAFARACELGGPADCANIGLAYATGGGVEKDVRRAAAYFKSACDHGSAAGCSGLGATYVLGDERMRNYRRAFSLFQKGCAGDDSNGCYNLGVLYEKGMGVRKNPTRAVPLYERACDADQASACGNLGTLVQSGAGVAKDAARAAMLFEKACDLEGAEGCLNAGRVYQAGAGVDRDKNRAASFYRRALAIEPDMADAQRALATVEGG